MDMNQLIQLTHLEREDPRLFALYQRLRSGEAPGPKLTPAGAQDPEVMLRPAGDPGPIPEGFLERMYADVIEHQRMLEKREEVLGFARVQRAGRLVHHDDLRVPAEGLADFDHLLDADGELPDRACNIELEPDLSKHATRLAPLSGIVDPSRPRVFTANDLSLTDGNTEPLGGASPSPARRDHSQQPSIRGTARRGAREASLAVEGRCASSLLSLAPCSLPNTVQLSSLCFEYQVRV